MCFEDRSDPLQQGSGSDQSPLRGTRAKHVRKPADVPSRKTDAGSAAWGKEEAEEMREREFFEKGNPSRASRGSSGVENAPELLPGPNSGEAPSSSQVGMQ